MATLRRMALLANDAARDPAFREFAFQFPGWRDVLSWTLAHFRYRDEYLEVVRDPRKMLEDVGKRDGFGRVMDLEGDCDDVATFLVAVLKVLGYRVRLLAMRTSESTAEFEHVVAQCFDSGEWITLDPTVSPGTQMTVLDELIQTV